MKGYEEAEAITGVDGRFRFAKLYPSSAYSLSFVSGQWESNAAPQVQTGPPRTSRLGPPIHVRFMRLENGVIWDSKTELQWAPDTGVTPGWNQAKEYVANSRVGGNEGWRLPTRKELFDLFEVRLDPSLANADPAAPAAARSTLSYLRINPFFNLGACGVWTSEVSDAPLILPPDLYDQYNARLQGMTKVWQFNFCDGQYSIRAEDTAAGVVNGNGGARVLAVRSGGSP